MGCNKCVERQANVEVPDLYVRPSLREHRQPETADAVAMAGVEAEVKSAGRVPAPGDIAEWLLAAG